MYLILIRPVVNLTYQQNKQVEKYISVLFLSKINSFKYISDNDSNIYVVPSIPRPELLSVDTNLISYIILSICSMINQDNFCSWVERFF